MLKILPIFITVGRAHYEDSAYRDFYEIPDYYDEIFGIEAGDNFSSYQDFAELNSPKNCKERLKFWEILVDLFSVFNLTLTFAGGLREEKRP